MYTIFILLTNVSDVFALSFSFLFQNRITDLHDQSVESIPADEIDIRPVPEIDFQTKIFQTKQYGRVIKLFIVIFSFTLYFCTATSVNIQM